MKLKRFGLSLTTYVLFSLPNGVLAEEKTDAYYWSGSIAAVCNLYSYGQLSAADARSYMKRTFPIIDKMSHKYKDIVYNFFYEINDGSCKKLAPWFLNFITIIKLL